MTEKSQLQLMATLNELVLKAVSSESRQALFFLIANDTHQIVSYDRGFLFDLRRSAPKIVSVSGQLKIEETTEHNRLRCRFVQDFIDPKKMQVVNRTSFTKMGEEFEIMVQKEGTSILFVPIMHKEKLLLGLWLERWHDLTWTEQQIRMLGHLARSYGLAYSRFRGKIPAFFFKFTAFVLLIAITIATFLIPVPLRIVAPCEVVPQDPLLITSPLEGIIEKVTVKPGQEVEEGELLFVYDKQAPMQELKVAQKQVEISTSQLKRILTLGVNDPQALREADIWRLRLNKDKINLNYAQYQADKLEVLASEKGIVAMDDPDNFRGKPVKIGEKVMMLIDHEHTKVKIWIPEDDNIEVNPDKLVHIFFNVDPATSYDAKLNYISNSSVVTEKGVPSFVAEALFVKPPDEVKIGWKGTAVIYGKEVSLFYFVFRKPWYTIRRITGI